MALKSSLALPEWEFAAKFLAASVAGFATDAGLLHIVLAAGATPAWARVVSLACAMQVAFAANIMLMIKQVDRTRLSKLWARYMAAQGLGNLCNYWVFVALASTQWPFLSNHLIALTAGAVIGWMVNYAGARFVVFAAPTAQS